MSKRTVATLRRPARHVFQPDPGDRTICGAMRGDRLCGLPSRNELHQLPPTSPEARAHDARMLGEFDGDDD